MIDSIALIGFGEAARAFAAGAGWRARAIAFDIKTLQPGAREAMERAYLAAGVRAAPSAREALSGADVVLSLVTADQALASAKADARNLIPGALWFDMNSVAPDTKRAAAAVIEEAGARYVDVAVMSPVFPARTGVPLLVSGPHAEAGLAALSAAGFSKARVVPGHVGAASAIKMIRSVMIKGMEALSAECLAAADRADVVDEVVASLGGDWPAKLDYNLDRMLVHGTRRAAEMDEVVKTLESLGVAARMARGAAAWQRAAGALDAGALEGLTAKLKALAEASGLKEQP